MEQSHLLLRRYQRRTLFTLWITYALMYFGRVNMAIALPFIEQEFGWTTASLSLISGAFFAVYALGQLVNGILGDHLSARWFVFVGLLGTALMNLCFGWSRSLGAMILFWGLNGVFQSMGWGPILKTASNWTRAEERNKVSGFLGTTFVLGSLASWYISGQVLGRMERWELVFWFPGVVLLLQALIWVFLIRDNPAELGITLPGSGAVGRRRAQGLCSTLKDTAAFLRQPTFLLLAVVTIVQGMIKDGITFWTPTLLVQSHNQSIAMASLYALVVPLFGFVGVVSTTWFNHHLGDRDERALGVLFGIGAILALGVRRVFTGDSVLFLTLLIGLCGAIINGINIVLLSSIPLRYAHSGKTSSLAGFLDFASYVGSALMTVITGVVVNLWGWGILLWLWVGLFVLGALILGVDYVLTEKSQIKGEITCQ